MRDMARIVTLDHTIPMFEKDKICCAVFKETAYEVIIPKEGAEPGKLYAFIEADALLPVVPAWEFLRKRCYNETLDKFLIKPMKMGAKDFNGEKGEPVRSWGLAVTIDELPITEGEKRRLKAGDDITEALGILKYEPIEDASPKKGEGKKAYPKWVKFCLFVPFLRWIGRIWQANHRNSAGGFPSHLISKSDETTLQNMKWVLDKYADADVIITAKMEGQSATVAPDLVKNKIKSIFPCSRNNAYRLKCNNTFWNVMEKYDVANNIKKLAKENSIIPVIQAEQCGPDIQQNIYCLKSPEWYVYTMKDALTGKQLSFDEMVATAHRLGIPAVPMLASGKMKDFFPDVDTAIKWAENKFWTYKKGKFVADYTPQKGEKLWKDYFQWEGVVVRTLDYDKDNNVGCSFKIKNLEYASHGLGKIHNECAALLAVKR